MAGTGGLELRWPWTKHGPAATQTIEPVVQLVYSPNTTAAVPNGDSTLVEFDAGNLFSFDRFPGADAVETGFRANVGVNYDAIFASGLDLAVTAGRVLRLNPSSGFPVASGLSGHQFRLAGRLEPVGRQRCGACRSPTGWWSATRCRLTKGELRMDLVRAHYDLSGGYSYVTADPQEDRPEPISEIVLDGSYAITDNWKIQSTSRYNVAASRLAEAGVNLTYRNECINLDLSLSRRYTSSTSLKPSTDFGLSVELLGFGGTGLPGMARQCR